MYLCAGCFANKTRHHIPVSDQTQYKIIFETKKDESHSAAATTKLDRPQYVVVAITLQHLIHLSKLPVWCSAFTLAVQQEFRATANATDYPNSRVSNENVSKIDDAEYESIKRTWYTARTTVTDLHLRMRNANKTLQTIIREAVKKLIVDAHHDDDEFVEDCQWTLPRDIPVCAEMCDAKIDVLYRRVWEILIAPQLIQCFGRDLFSILNRYIWTNPCSIIEQQETVSEYEFELREIEKKHNFEEQKLQTIEKSLQEDQRNEQSSMFLNQLDSVYYSSTYRAHNQQTDKCDHKGKSSRKRHHEQHGVDTTIAANTKRLRP